MRSKRESLIRAASKGRLEAFKGHLQPDASISLQEANFTLEKLAGIAARHHHSKIFKFCIGIGANVNDEAVRMGVLQFNRLSVYKTVVAAGFDLQYDHDGTNGGPLIWATLANHIPLAMYLLDHGVDVNRDLQSGVYRPLAKAAEINSVAMIELLIAYGAQIDRSGALIVAAENGSLDAVRCLVSHGANINLMRTSDTDLYTKTLEEQSALHKAVKGGHEDVVAFLVENGAELSLLDHEGKDALIMAVETNNAEIFQIIYDARKWYSQVNALASFLILRKVIYTPHKTPYRFDEAMLASGFTAAPVSQCLFFGVIASSILVSITDAKYLFYIQVVPHLWPYRQAWRVLVWQSCYNNSTELLFAAMSLYQMRVIERLWGSRKFASFICSVLPPTLILPPLITTMLRPLTFGAVNNLPAGPTPLIFALLAQYHAAIPTIYKYRIVTSKSPATSSGAGEDQGPVLSDKFLVYLLAGQLALSSFPGSTIAAGVGWMVGVAWRGEWGPGAWGRWRVPGWVVGEKKAHSGQGFERLRRRLEGEGSGTGSEGRDAGEARRRTLGRGILDQFRGAF